MEDNLIISLIGVGLIGIVLIILGIYFIIYCFVGGFHMFASVSENTTQLLLMVIAWAVAFPVMLIISSVVGYFRLKNDDLA